MGFFTGRVGFVRFRVTGGSSGMFGPEHLKKLAAHGMGKQNQATAEGLEVGWTAGDHILDTQFDLEKNILNDTLHFALRMDQHKIPADLLRAYTMIELQALAAENPSGHASARQKREARAAARDKLETESRDGRYLRRKAYPVLWDSQAQELLFASPSANAIAALRTLFQKTFGHAFEILGAGGRAFVLAEANSQTRGVDDARPTAFVPGRTASEVAWIPDENNRDFLGNEFLLWLWYFLDAESDAIALGDESEVTAMVARNLVLECPRGQTGRESIHSEDPSQLPEAHRAIQSGKLPRQAGLTLVRHDQQYELTLQAETLAVTGAKLPESEADDERARLEERVTQIRHLCETLDLLYDAYCRKRLGEDWTKEVRKMQKWLRREETARVSAQG